MINVLGAQKIRADTAGLTGVRMDPPPGAPPTTTPTELRAGYLARDGGDLAEVLSGGIHPETKMHQIVQDLSRSTARRGPNGGLLAGPLATPPLPATTRASEALRLGSVTSAARTTFRRLREAVRL